jgi:hypothetical protein
MENEKILAMAILAIVDTTNNSKYFYSFKELEILKNYNKKIELAKYNEDGDLIEDEKETIIDERLQKIILLQEEKNKQDYNKLKIEAEDILKNNSDKINIIKNILNNVL